ncbi:MAG: hypothetical protein J6R29_06000, partial [Clostridia bacterium]|nr:hypothetical protein [Clostridia bacterium]
ATYTASITYREETLRADFVAHDKALKEQVASGEIKAEDAKYYFTNGEPNDAEFKALMDKVYGERLMARAYVEVVTENGTEYVYSQNTVTASVRGVATGKYLEYEDDGKWEQDYGWVATKYLGEISHKNAFVDLESGEIVGTDLRGYVDFTMGEEDLTVGDSQLDADLVIGEKSYFGASLKEDKVAGQTYTLTATDMLGNILLLNVTPATKVLKTKEDIYNTFNLSTNNKTYCKPVGNGVSCTIDGYFVLGNDIDMTGVILDHNLICARETGTTAPAYGVGFYGTFDGNGYTISNLDLRRANTGLTTISTSPDFRKAAVRDENGVLTSSTSSYHAVVADTHECNHDAVSGVGTRGAGLFGALGYGSTIKNVALTNVNASHSSVIAVMTEGAQSNYDGGASTYVGFGGYDEVSSSGYAWRYTSGVTTCTQATGCPVHGSDTASCDGGYYGKCTGTRFCIIHQTGVDHTAEWIPLVKLGTAYYADFACENIYIRKDLTLTADQAKITYENIFIDINEDTINFRGVFNMLGSSKVDKITTMNNVVINYNGADATIASTGILRGHNLVSTTGNHGIAFEKTTINDMVVISKNPANLITNNGPYVASNLDGTKKIANVLQYSSYADYLTAIKLGVSIDGFKNLNYWDVKKYGVPYWKTSLEDVYFKVDGEASDGTLEYSAPAIGNQKQYQVTAYNLLDEAFPEFDAVSSTNEDVATVTKQGLITIKGTTSSPEATAVVTLTAQGKVFTAVITLQGGYTEVSAETEITYSQDQGKFDFGGYAVDPDDNPETENSVAVSNANIVSASVIYGEEIIELTKQTIQITDYNLANPGHVGGSGLDSAGKGDDTKVNFTAFMGDIVRYTVTKDEEGNYVPDLKTQKLLVKFNVGTDEAPIYKTYLFENLKAYTAIITNIGKINELFSITTNGQSTAGYYILANSIRGDRAIYKMNHVKSAVENASTIGFQGVFDGQGHQIGKAITTENNYGGLFGKITSTSEMPTTIRNVSISAYAGSASYALLANSVVSDVYTNVLDKDGVDTGIKQATYPLEVYNFHYKPYQKMLHGLFY